MPPANRAVAFVCLLVLLGGCVSGTAAPGDAGKKPLRGQGLVVATDPLAVRAGAEMLARGGNAVDAALAVNWVLSVVEPISASLGGDTAVLLYVAHGKRIFYADGESTAPAGTTSDQAFEEDGKTLRSDLETRGFVVNTPGTVAVLWEVHQRYGQVPWHETLQPSIQLARDGFPVSDIHAVGLKHSAEKLKSWPESAELFYEGTVCPPTGFPDRDEIGCHVGRPYEAGEYWSNPDQARALELLANEGAAPFYRGEIAQAIVSAVARREGRMTMDDLAHYEVEWREPLRGQYHGYDIVTSPPPAGGLILAETLGILAPLVPQGEKPDEGGRLHAFIESGRLAIADRNAYLADPAYEEVPVRGLLSSEYLDERRSLFDDDHRTVVFAPGDPWPYQGRGKSGNASASKADTGGHTTAFLVIDSQGNIASVTSTVGNDFGSGIAVPGYGFALNHRGIGFDETGDTIDRREPGKRPQSYVTPTILLKDGLPVLVTGAAGSEKIPWAVAQVIQNVVDGGLPPQAAVDAPRVMMNARGEGTNCNPVNNPHVRWDRALAREAQQWLVDRGHHMDEIQDPLGLAVAQLAIATSGGWQGGSDTRVFFQGAVATVAADGSVAVTSPEPWDGPPVGAPVLNPRCATE